MRRKQVLYLLAALAMLVALLPLNVAAQETKPTDFLGDDLPPREAGTRLGPTSGPDVIDPSASAIQIAQAIARDPIIVTGASFVTEPPIITTANAWSDTPLTAFPINGTSYGILTSGNAVQADQPGTFSSLNLDGGAVRGDTDRDVTILRIDLNVPTGNDCLSVDFQFLSEEYPVYVGSIFNDAFVAELDNSTWTTSGSTITAPNNFAFDPDGNVVSINSTGVAQMSPNNGIGTAYDSGLTTGGEDLNGAATVLLRAATPVTSGAHSIYLSIFDQGDNSLDSAVFLDNLLTGMTGPNGCVPGATQVPEIALYKTVGTTPGVCAVTDEITVAPGTEVTYCYTVENTGVVTLNLHDLVDSELGSILSGYPNALTPGQTVSVTQAAMINATTVNTATWTAYNAGPIDVVTATDMATVTVGIPNTAAISLNKTVGATPGVCAAGDNITVTAGTEVYYCYQVQNTGDVTLNFHDLVDSELGTVLDNLPYVLAPGAFSPQVIVPATPMATVTNVGTWTAYSSLAGYAMDDTIPYNWEDISGTGTPIALSDDSVSPAIPLGFAFDYFGSNYSDVYVSSNGFLTVNNDPNSGCCSGQPIPTPGSPDGVLAGWWEDLNPGAGGAIHYQTLGSAPNRTFIVQFTNVPHFGGGNEVTMQWKLFEGLNVIEVHYQAAPSEGGTHSAGIENADGSAGVQYYYGTGSLTTPEAVRYAPVPVNSATDTDTATVTVLIPNIDVNPLSLSSTQPPNTSTVLPMTVANTGQGNLDWTITEVEPAAPPVGVPAGPTAFERPVITSSKQCGPYMGPNAGPVPEGFLEYCAPAGRQPGPAIKSPLAPTDTAYSLELISGSFFSFPLNNFAAQTGVGTQTRPLFAMDFNADATTMYAIDYDTWDFGTVDLNSAAFTVMGASTPLGGQSWTGLTIDPLTNEAYASSCDISSSAIYSVNLANGATTLIGTTSDAPCLIDISISPNGDMYGHDIVNNAIYLVNRSTAAVTLVGPTGYDSSYAQGMDFDNDTGTLYIFLFDVGSFGTIYGTVDLNTGAVTPLAFAQDLEYEGAVQNTSYCAAQDAPWLSLSPTAGTTAGGASTPVVATFDSTGLVPGVYTGQLCVRSNDPDPGPGNETNLVLVPVTLIVEQPPTLVCNGPGENFDAEVPPTGWSVVTNLPNGPQWTTIAGCGELGNYATGNGGAACASGLLYPDGPFDTELRSPMFSLVGWTGGQLNFQLNFQSWAGIDRLGVDISANGGTTWASIRTYDSNQGTLQGLPGENITLDLTPWAGQPNLMLRWRYYSPAMSPGWYAQVDEVKLKCAAPPPTAVSLATLDAASNLPLPVPAGLPLAALPAAASLALGAAYVLRRRK